MAVFLAYLANAALPSFDFTLPEERAGWVAAHDIATLEATAEGLRVTISGEDPYLIGPPRDYPAGTPLWLSLRLKSEQGGMCQVFYFRDQATEANSIRFSVPAREWFESKVRLPALGTRYRLRIDPPGARGVCDLARLQVTERVTPTAPEWPVPTLAAPDNKPLTVVSGELELRHYREALGAFEVRVDGRSMAGGNPRALMAYAVGSAVRWVSFGNGANFRFRVERAGRALAAKGRFQDPDGANWEVEQRFTAGAAPGVIELEARVTVDRDRSVFFLPVLTLLPGMGSFGTNKTQGLFAGIEYLENEPSSSEADVRGQAALRRVPDTLKSTLPLMVIAAQQRYVGLIWQPTRRLCAVFDSPDRTFKSGGHMLGLLFPGSDGSNREEGSLLPYNSELLAAGQPLVVRAAIIGGRGKTVVPAVQQYLALHPLPPAPNLGQTAQEYFEVAARGWLDSKIRASNLYRHAAWPGFSAIAAADAACYEDWLAEHVHNPSLRRRLSQAARGALGQVPPDHFYSAQVGHVRYPLPPLIYGNVATNATEAQRQGRALLSRFTPDGSVLYHRTANGPDSARTHFAPDANGLTASVVVGVLEAALFSGDHGLLDDGLRYLRALNKFQDTVPRDAQTWEVPLHTPDILAAAHLVRAYTIGYELTGDAEFLEQARYWAWTGVPFVYLTPPTSQPVGLYSTIPVLGATQWVAPLWIGLPVQWCGIVYAHALYQLAEQDATGPWKQLADGITLSGIQQTYPATELEYVGLLPDSFNLRPQSRNPPAINPATVLALAPRALTQERLYSFHAFRQHGLLVHAPGSVVATMEQPKGVRLTVNGWPSGPYWVLINGLKERPELHINDANVPLAAPHEYQPLEGRLILELSGQTTIELTWP